MIIITEGPDSSGKTTLIQALSEELKLARVGTYDRTQPQHYQHWVEACPHNIITDRWPAISDLVYGPILGRGTWSSMKQADTPHFLIYCRPQDSEIMNTIHNKPQLEGVIDNAKSILRAYDDLMAQLNPSFIYDYTQPRSYTTLINHLKRHL